MSGSRRRHYNVTFLEPTPVDVYVEDIDIQTVNISWSPLRLPPSLMIQDINLVKTYILIVTTMASNTQILQLYQPFNVFTAASEGAPPCKVYNFSVTATYIGATYTGAGCSVPSPVLSKMLPSLPDINRLESSLEYVLEIGSDRSIFLKASFLVSCDGIVKSACMYNKERPIAVL